MFISKLAVWFPDQVLTNEDLARMVDTTTEWIVEHVGIRERHRSPTDMPIHALGAQAAAQVLNGFNPAKIDLVLCALSITDYHIPSTANLIAAEIGCGDAAAFDLKAACSSFVFALHTLRGLLTMREHRRALLVIPEAYTHVTDYSDRATCILWGDAAFACIVSHEQPSGRSLQVEDTFIGSRSKDAQTVQIPVGGTFQQQGNVVQAFAIRKMADVIRTVLKRNKLAPPDIAYVVGHQANLGILTRACARAGIAPAKNLTNIEDFGNTGAAGAPAVLAQNMGQFHPGERIVVATVGSGLSWGGALLQVKNEEEKP